MSDLANGSVVGPAGSTVYNHTVNHPEDRCIGLIIEDEGEYKAMPLWHTYITGPVAASIGFLCSICLDEFDNVIGLYTAGGGANAGGGLVVNEFKCNIEKLIGKTNVPVYNFIKTDKELLLDPNTKDLDTLRFDMEDRENLNEILDFEDYLATGAITTV